jgi:putative transcriptional regulator
LNASGLAGRTKELFLEADFAVAEAEPVPGVSFDLVCRRDEQLIVVGVTLNVSTFSRAQSREMKLVAQMIGGVPLLVSTHRDKAPLYTGIVYLRFGITTVSPETLGEYLIEGVPPLVFSAPGGYYVRLEGSKLNGMRNGMGHSLGDLASALGVSRRTIQMYEEGMCARLDVALRLEEMYKDAFVCPIDPFSASSEAKSAREDIEEMEEISNEVFARLDGMGFKVIPFSHCPFDAVVCRQKGFFAGLEEGSLDLRSKARTMSSLARLSDYRSVLFVSERGGRCNLEGTPIVGKPELKRMRDPEDMLDLIEDRQGKEGG